MTTNNSGNGGMQTETEIGVEEWINMEMNQVHFVCFLQFCNIVVIRN